MSIWQGISGLLSGSWFARRKSSSKAEEVLTLKDVDEAWNRGYNAGFQSCTQMVHGLSKDLQNTVEEQARYMAAGDTNNMKGSYLGTIHGARFTTREPDGLIVPYHAPHEPGTSSVEIPGLGRVKTDQQDADPGDENDRDPNRNPDHVYWPRN